jgi:CRISPR-associated endonuclease Csn1
MEQERQCIYTGKVISCTDLFDGNKFDFEHTIPADLSFNNELNNLTICESSYNRQIKGKRIPSELPNYESEVIIAGESYSPIKPRLKFICDKVESFEKLVNDWKNRTKVAADKDRKDYCIQQRHYFQFELDYWKKKLDTFTITEYKSGWRNSQLRDTQIVTKYALPYLKTVFDKVEVQKGIITHEFKKIFNVGFVKDRRKHSHHAVDAAVLTLIPPASQRDLLLKVHFEAEENRVGFHSTPNGWRSFNPEIIKNIEVSTLINYIAIDRTLITGKKIVRKRGKIQFVKEKSLDGRLVYKTDVSGNKIPLIAQGDSIRGQLHEESFLGAIKEYKFDANGKPELENGIPLFKKDKDGTEKLTFVKRILLKDFKSMGEFEKIVDQTVREHIKKTIDQRLLQGDTFKEAIVKDIWMVDKNGQTKRHDNRGNIILPIRHVRCKVAVGGGTLTKEKALQIKEHAMPSKHEHKRFVYAKNEEMSVCLYYEGDVNGKVEKVFRLMGLFELAQYKLDYLTEINLLPDFQYCEVGRGKKKSLIPLKYILTTGMRVLIWKDTPEEIRDLNSNEILTRLYNIYKFNAPSSEYIFMRYHLEARSDDELGPVERTINTEKYQPLISVVAKNFNCLLEGYDFNIALDGEIILK